MPGRGRVLTDRSSMGGSLGAERGARDPLPMIDGGRGGERVFARKSVGERGESEW